MNISGKYLSCFMCSRYDHRWSQNTVCENTNLVGIYTIFLRDDRVQRENCKSFTVGEFVPSEVTPNFNYGGDTPP